MMIDEVWIQLSEEPCPEMLAEWRQQQLEVEEGHAPRLWSTRERDPHSFQ